MIIVYTLEGCGSCEYLKDLLSNHNIEYEEVNIGQPGNIEVKKKMKEKGFKGVPIISINGEIYEGYNISNVKRILEINDYEER